MSEKTSEEKLREELEGNSLTGESSHSSSSEGREKSSSSRLRGVRRRISSGTDKSIGQRVDSFIDEFEKKIEESLAGGNIKAQSSSSSSRQDKPRINRKAQPDKTDKSEVREERAKIKAPVNLPHDTKTEKQNAIVPDNREKEKAQERSQTEIESASSHEEHKDTEQPWTVNIAADDEPQVINDAEKLAEHEDILQAENVNDTTQAVNDAEHEEPVQNDNIKEIPNVIPEPEEISQTESVKENPQIFHETINEPEHEDIQPVDVIDDIPQIIPEAKDMPEYENISQAESIDEIPQVIPEVEPAVNQTEDVHEDLSVEDEPEPEETEQTEQTEPHENGLPDIPLIDSELSDGEDNNELPDIPVISADDVEDPDTEEELEEFEDIPVIDAETENESESESESEDEAEPQEYDDNMPEAITENDEPESEPEPEPEEYDSDMAAADNEDNADNEEVNEEFLHPADIIVNVDSDLPQIIDEPEPEPEPDPEAEAVPVSVTMPETTKTAEDKLMADIAEAMTGNPLTLESKESPEPYRLPENFYTSQNADNNSEQSAEDKLKANIAQAMSESPLGIAQQQAMQDLEKDLNPFDDISSLSELAERTSPRITESESDSESEQEQEEDNNDKDEAFLPDFTDEPQDVMTDPENENEFESESEDDASSPFDVDINTNDELEEPEMNLDELPLSDDVNDDIPDEEPLVESDAELEVEDVPLPESEPEPESESESEPMTAQQRLEQEIAQFTQDAPEEPEESVNDKDTQHEEVVPENKMPENLLDENEHEHQADDEIGDDWDINSLGILSEAASIPDEEPEPEPEPELEPSFMTETEETHKEKTMGIREKLAARKNGAAQKDSSSSSAAAKKTSSSYSYSGGGLLLPLLLFLLLIVGGLTLWQLYTLPDKLASVIAMNSEGASGVFDSVSGIESKPSYDYAIDFIIDQNIAERMSQRGRDGWQVVGSRRTQDTTSGQYGYEIIFMRRISGR